MKPSEEKTKIYMVDVDFKYGPIETYRVKAKSRSEARKKAKERYVKDYFRKNYMETYVYPD